MPSLTLNEIQRMLVRDGNHIFEVYSRFDTGECVFLMQHKSSRHYYVAVYDSGGVFQKRPLEISLSHARTLFDTYVASVRDF